MIFILSCVFIVSNALKNEMFVTLKSLPDITIQRIVAGRQTLIDVNRCEKISKIFGVKKVMPRVWGYYYLPSLGVNFSVVGVESFAKQYNESLNDIVDKYSDKLIGGDNMVVGIGVLKMLKKWLKIIPGMNKFFLQQEAKLKADKFLEIENNREKEFQERLLRSRMASAKVIDSFNKQLEWDEKYWWVYVIKKL